MLQIWDIYHRNNRKRRGFLNFSPIWDKLACMPPTQDPLRSTTMPALASMSA